MTRILLVEDIDSDAVLTQEALRESGLLDDVETVRDGDRALALLRGDGPLPGLVLLDLDLPGISGRAVLDAMKGDATLATIPVVVLTTSEAPRDVAFAYAHHANAYVRKPNGFLALRGVTDAIRDFWVQAASIPPVAA